MIGTETAIKFRQMFYHSDGVSHASAPAGNIAIGTETNWMEDAASQDSYFIVQTQERGVTKDRLRISTARVQMWQDVQIGALQEVDTGPRSLAVHARGGDAEIGLRVDQATARVALQDTTAKFVIEKNASVLRIDASDDIDGALHLTPGSSGELRVAGDKVVVAASDGETNITGSVHIGDASRAGMPRLLRVFEPSGGTAQLTVSSTAELRLASASATDAAKISLSGGAYLFELAQVGSTLSIASTSNDGSVFVSPGATGRFAVRTGAGADLVGVDGTTGTTAIAGNVSVGSPGASGARLVSVATADGEAGLQLFSGGNAAKAGIYLTSPSASGLTAQFRVLKTDCPLSNGLPRPACSSLRLDASAAGTNGEVRVLGAKIHVDDGHLMANELTLRSATAVGFQGETIDLNSGQVTSGASVLAISPGPTMPNDPLPTETITINNRRITPTSLVLASVVAQCNSRSGVTIVKIAPQVGTVSFEVANFGTRACGGGDINQNERYTINFFLMGDTNAAF